MPTIGDLSRETKRKGHLILPPGQRPPCKFTFCQTKGQGGDKASWESRTLHSSRVADRNCQRVWGQWHPPSLPPVTRRTPAGLVLMFLSHGCVRAGEEPVYQHLTPKFQFCPWHQILKSNNVGKEPQRDVEYSILDYPWHSFVSMLNRNIMQDRWGDHEIGLKDAWVFVECLAFYTSGMENVIKFSALCNKKDEGQYEGQ